MNNDIKKLNQHLFSPYKICFDPISTPDIVESDKDFFVVYSLERKMIKCVNNNYNKKLVPFHVQLFVQI